MIDKESSMDAHLATLLSFHSSASRADEKWTAFFNTAHDDLAHVLRFVEAEHFANFAEGLISATCIHVEEFVAAAKRDEELAARAHRLQQMLQSASVAFPMDTSIQDSVIS